MPNYSHRGGGRYGAVVGGERIVPGRLVYLSKTRDEQHAWRIRDFIGGCRFTSEDCPLALADIEQLAEYCDTQPPPLNAEEEVDAWRAYLVRRSQEVYGEDYDADAQPALACPVHPL